MKSQLLVATLALCAIAPAVRANLVNGSFEQPVIAAGSICSSTLGFGVFTYASCGTVPGWTGVFQLGNGSTGFGIPQPDPNGTQALILQSFGRVGSYAFQDISAPASSFYLLTWLDAGRLYNGTSQTYNVLLDGSVVGSFVATSGMAWTAEGLSLAVTAGTHRLTFQTASNSTNDQTAFIDNVSWNGVAGFDAPIPEPSSFALAGLGAFLFAAARSKFRKA